MSGLSPSVWPHGRKSLGIRADSLAGGRVELVFALWGRSGDPCKVGEELFLRVGDRFLCRAQSRCW